MPALMGEEITKTVDEQFSWRFHVPLKIICKTGVDWIRIFSDHYKKT